MRVVIAFYRTLASQSSASLTAGYLAAHMRKAGHAVQLVQLIKTSSEHDVELLAASKPDVVFYKPNFKDIDRLPSNLAALEPSRICLFGPFAALNSDALLRAFSMVRGVLMPNHEHQASHALSWLMSELTKPPAGVVGRGAAATQQVRQDASEIQNAMWDVMPARDIERLEPTFFVNLEATRGCLRACTFCHVPAATKAGGGEVLRRDPRDVVQEMEELWDLGKRYFIFNDPVFGGGGAAGARWIDEFVNIVARSGRRFLLYVYLTLNELQRHPDMVQRLASAGLLRIFVGIESSSDSAVGRLRKGIRVASYGSVKSELRRLRVVPHIGFMLFHPFAKSTEILEGIEFLHQVGELHRFGVILEKTRLVPQTLLLKQATDAGLVIDSGYRELGHGYRFAEEETGRMYSRFQACFGNIGIPLLERLEHLFVTGEFIDNLVLREGRPSVLYEHRATALTSLRSAYCDEFLSLARVLVQGVAADKSVASFGLLWRDSEVAWEALLHEASVSGVDKPLAWIPTGDLQPESVDRSGYDGARVSTRSGTLEVRNRL